VLYLAVVALTMFVLPLASVGCLYAGGATDLLRVTGASFVFWGVGVRLTLAGLRQYFQPQFTARDILGLKGSESFVIVRELGGANIATGIAGLASLALPTFVPPVALAAAIFYAFAAGEHLKSGHRERNENVALWSDVFIALVLTLYLVGVAVRGAF
jgi:hypothetical protein